MTDTAQLWLIILALGAGSFGLRFVFLGIVGNRDLPPWLLRHLRYTAVAVIPALIAPLVVWPAATQGAPDAPRLAAAVATFAVGYFTKNVLAAMVIGAAVLIGLNALI
ncbi:AzlD domain-containing protein [Marivita sp. GX14005]|uniref:AzlD domain-containing protein n=1 Tax=Marivita sp. GX14005 TaxID=2942276 RepID=UPI0020195D8E|nr:AzlD domain-containing protein [Marivita sp. GX14005]MCL3881811.1 AzlD domain-containing protein [Marivita sp. GX14005]